MLVGRSWAVRKKYIYREELRLLSEIKRLMRIYVYIEIADCGLLPYPLYVGCVKLVEEGKFIGYLNGLSDYAVDMEQFSLERQNKATLVSGFMALDANGDVKGMACLNLPNRLSERWDRPDLYVVRNMAVDGMRLVQSKDGDEFGFWGGAKVTVEDISWDDGISEEIEYLNSLMMRLGCENTKELLESAGKILLPMLRNVM